MGLLAALRRLSARLRGPVLHEADGLRCTASAAARLAAMPGEQALHLRTEPCAWGLRLHASVGPAAGARRLLGGRLVVSDADLHALRATVLNHDGEDWTVAAELDVHPVDTPNPTSRLYRCDRLLAEGSLYLSQAGPDAPLPHHLLRDPRVRSVLLQGHQLSVEREPGVPWPELDALVRDCLHAWVAHGALPASAATSRAADSLEAAVWEVIEAEVLPTLRRDGGDLRLIAIDGGVVKVELVGACAGCPASQLTLKGGVERTLKRAFPEQITSVQAV
jgi:Fe-S cluster biogenesis protein NfuA